MIILKKNRNPNYYYMPPPWELWPESWFFHEGCEQCGPIVWLNGTNWKSYVVLPCP